SKDARAVWSQIVDRLGAANVLTRADANALVRYCDAFVLWKKAAAFIQEKGSVYTLKDEKGKAKCVMPWPQVAEYHKRAAMLLKPWQQAGVGNLFGWKRRDEKGRVVRRYREVFLYVPRKNGKTPLSAGICNYVLFCDGEPGAQIYSAAAEKEQAALLYRHAV